MYTSREDISFHRVSSTGQDDTNTISHYDKFKEALSPPILKHSHQQ